MKKLKNLGKTLSKKDQRNLTAGTGDTCSVTCSVGYYACCCAGDCRCISDLDHTDYQCSAGGQGSTSCSYGHDPD